MDVKKKLKIEEYTLTLKGISTNIYALIAY